MMGKSFGVISCLLFLLVSTSEGKDGELRITMGTSGRDNIMQLLVNDDAVLQASLGVSIPDNKGKPIPCDDNDDSKHCWRWGSNLRLQVDEDPSLESCYIVNWWTNDKLINLTDCFLLGDSNWYGVGNPVWPLQQTSLKGISATTGGWHDRSSLMERYWITSTGAAIKADDDIPLFLTLKPPSFKPKSQRTFCLTSLFAEPYRYRLDTPLRLRYTVCHGKDQKDVFLQTRDHFFTRPQGMPDERMIMEPVWSSWARYKAAINTSVILEFAKEIVEKQGFTQNSQFEVDDMWETCYGDHEFDLTKFPDPKEMVTKLKEMNFRVTFWVHPFINRNCKNHAHASDKGYLVKNPKGESAMTVWWNGNASAIDFTKPEAAEWFRNRLQSIRDTYGVDSFKFDAGETLWLPPDFVLGGPMSLAPDYYTTRYIDTAKYFGNLAEFRSGHKSHNVSMFVRMIDRDSTWANNTATGIKTVIPITLQYGILGYPYVMPDMVGGNAYGNFPDRELYIRWVELNTFLPCIQFSIVPWDYDSQVVNITKQMLSIRNKYKDYILKTAREGLTGLPMIRPLWWLDPTDYEAQVIDTEFLVGNDLLVAPVLEQGAVTRDIFFPKGKWQNSKEGKLYVGPLWVLDYPVALNELAYFDRVAEE